MKHFFTKLGIGFIKLIALLPFSVLFLISDLLYIIIYKFIKYRVKVVRENLENSFPNKTEIERLEIEKKYYRYLCDLIVESLKGIKITKKEILKRLKFENLEVFDNLYKEGKSAIIVMGHYANWELLCKGTPLFVKNKIIVAYKPLSNKSFDDMMLQSRTEFGTNLVPMEKIPRILAECKEPFLLVLVADQSPSHKESSIWVNFLNQETAVLPGAEKLAKKYNLPVLFASLKHCKRGYYSCLLEYITQLPKTTLNITELHTQKLESLIINQPEFWVWSHKRWKMKR